MTDQELLQQAKDQVAKKADYKGCTDWTSFKSRMNNDGYEMQPYHDEASLLAIQSAREEGTLKDAIKILNRIAPTANPKEYKYLSEAVAALELIRDGHLRN